MVVLVCVGGGIGMGVGDVGCIMCVVGYFDYVGWVGWCVLL